MTETKEQHDPYRQFKQPPTPTPYQEQLQKHRESQQSLPPQITLPVDGIKIRISFANAVEIGAGIGCGMFIISIIIGLLFAILGALTGTLFSQIIASLNP